MIETIGINQNNMNEDLSKVSSRLENVVANQTSYSPAFSKTSIFNPVKWVEFIFKQKKFFSFIAIIVALGTTAVYSLLMRRGMDGSTFFTLLGSFSAVTFVGMLIYSVTKLENITFMSKAVFSPFYKLKIKKAPLFEVHQQKDNDRVFTVKNKNNSTSILRIQYNGRVDAEDFQDFLLKLDQIISEINSKIANSEIISNSTFSQLDNIKQATKNSKKIIEDSLDRKRGIDVEGATVFWIFSAIGLSTAVFRVLIIGLIYVVSPSYDKETVYKAYTKDTKIDKVLTEQKWSEPVTIQDVKKLVESNINGQNMKHLRKVEYCVAWGEGIKYYTVQFDKKATADTHYSYTISMKDGKLTPKSSSAFPKDECITSSFTS